MILKYLVQEFDGNDWKIIEELGFFDTIEEANEALFNSIECKKDFWTKYKVIQTEII
jgi:hypothetical protein